MKEYRLAPIFKGDFNRIWIRQGLWASFARRITGFDDSDQCPPGLPVVLTAPQYNMMLIIVTAARYSVFGESEQRALVRLDDGRDPVAFRVLQARVED